MSSVKKILYCVLFVCFVVGISNNVYADLAVPRTIINYSPLYYIAIAIVIAVVVGISILILKKIYKSNQLDTEENRKGEE